MGTLDVCTIPDAFLVVTFKNTKMEKDLSPLAQ